MNENVQKPRRVRRVTPQIKWSVPVCLKVPKSRADKFKKYVIVNVGSETDRAAGNHKSIYFRGPYRQATEEFYTKTITLHIGYMVIGYMVNPLLVQSPLYY